MENKRVPEVRFEGFSGDWEERKVKDFSEETFGGGTPKTSIKEYWSGEIPWIQSSDLQEHQVSGVFAKKKITEKGLQNSATKLIPKNSIAIVTRVGVGKIALIQFEYATSQDFLSLSNLKVNEWFGVYSLYNQLQKELHNVQGTSIKGITKNELLDKRINIPINLEEQTKIGNFFKQLDDTIALHQQELTTLKQTKQGFLQKMFPKEGESVPEVRFPGFSGEWGQHKLGDIGQTFTGLSGKSKGDFGHGSAEFVTYMNVFSNIISDISLTENVEIDSKQNELKYGDVLFTTSSETPQEVGMSSVWLDNRKNVYLNSFCFGYRPTVNINYLFLAYLLRSNVVRKQIMLLAQGISRYNISKSKVMELVVLLPDIKEQTKIGNFFKQLDDTIALHQRELDALQETKKAFLQKMFV
ncbi:EcoKI restriction-modification system protein HsdS [Bacillus subtilis]|nr:EcoKI restriction-modification system protein HsdS [Bacillus cereus]CUB43524.1 EcoKI restriction-modification system protein HsdS [Bacillus subtilis]